MGYKSFFLIMLFALMAFSACGGSGDSGGENPIRILSSPEAPSVIGSNSTLDLFWKPVSGATSYEIWYSTTNDPNSAVQQSGEINKTRFTLTGLTNGTHYYIWLKAKNSTLISEFSPVAIGKPIYSSSGSCDQDLSIDSLNPIEAAKAMGICDGLVSAEWILTDGTPKPSSDYYSRYDIGHGILSNFGSNVIAREGFKLLALSTGMARLPIDGEYTDIYRKQYGLFPYDPSNGSNGLPIEVPVGFPISEPNGETPGMGYDGIGLKVILKVPAGIKGFSFSHKYYTHDYPDWMRTEFVDQCCVIVAPTSNVTSGQNILFDPYGNYLFSSTTAIEIYKDSDYTDNELFETGFEGHGASIWLGCIGLADGVLFNLEDEIQISFMIWDSHDGSYDSTILLDNFQWLPSD